MVRAELSADKRPFAMWELRKGNTRSAQETQNRTDRIQEFGTRSQAERKKRKTPFFFFKLCSLPSNTNLLLIRLSST